MSRLFLSHSSANAVEAVAIRDWLNSEGWSEIFLDLDPQRGIAAGERWERALNEAASYCEAVIFLISRDWLNSRWCLKEFNLARRLNKRLFGALIEPIAIADLPGDLTGAWQVVDLASGQDHRMFRVVMPRTHDEGHVTFSNEGLSRLRNGLTKAGLDPRFFAWPPEDDPDRPPYRGLRPLEAEDAGIFFGREAPTVVALDRLRGLREASPPRVLVILGASGAGKSSFLRAGLIPRLARDDVHFLPLPVIRPETAVMSGATGLVTSLEAAFNAHGLPANRADITAMVKAGAEKLLPALEALAEKARAPGISGEARPAPPSLVFSIDQAEELFLAEGAQEAEAFLQLLKSLLVTSTPNLIALFTIRSDSYERLQTAKPLDGVQQEPFGLPPMPRGAYQTIIEGPAQRLTDSKRRLRIEPALTQALLSDIEAGGGKDSLPLLAFILERLYREYAADGDLLAKEYDALGRIKGAIRAAVEAALEAADSDPTITKDKAARLVLLRRALIPALAGIDPETGEPRRRVARMSEIPHEARGLINCLVNARLLATDSVPGTSEIIVEPAHEALLRQWDDLRGWLKEDSAALLMLDGVRQAARDWSANGRSGEWLGHSGGRLEDAERLRQREDFARFIAPTEQAYLDACRVEEDARRNRELDEARKLAEAERQVTRRTRLGLIGASVLALAALGAAAYGLIQANTAREQTVVAEERKTEAERQRVTAEQRSAVLAANVAQTLADEGSIDQALLVMLNAARWFDDSSAPDEIRIALSKALKKKSRTEVKAPFPDMQVFETDIGLFLANRKTGDIFLLSDSLSPARIHQGSEEDRQISLLEHNANDEDVIIVRENLEVQRLNPKGGSLRKVGSLSGTLDGASANPDVDPELEIADDGLVIRTSSLTENDAEVTYLQILDTRTGQSFDGRFDASPAIVRRLGTGEIYFIDYEQKPFRLKPGGTSLSVEEVSGLSEKQNIELRYGRCIAGAGAEVRAAISKLVDDFNAGSDVKCTKYGDTYLVTVLSPTSAGEERIDTLFASDGTSTEVRTRISDAITPEGLPSSNFSWVGMHPETRALAVLLNRDAFVEDDQGLRLHYRHPTVPQSARFIDARHLVVVEAEAGRLVQHDLGDRPSGELYASAASDIIGTEQPVATLHAGTCVGYSNPKSDTAVLPDGRKIRLNVASATSSNDVQEIQVSEAAGPRVLKLDKETTCIQFSADWKHLLSVNATNVSIYDFERALATQSLEKGKVGKIGIAGPSSAFFVGKSGDILTSNVTNRVLLWKGNGETWTSTELYRGESPIVYAEPDADGERILLLEVIGGGTVHGFMYSIKARQKWFDLGTDYKWLGAAFTDKHEVAVSKHNTWTDVFPVLPLSRLVEIAKKELTPSCQPARQGDFKSSPCWPSSIE